MQLPNSGRVKLDLKGPVEDWEDRLSRLKDVESSDGPHDSRRLDRAAVPVQRLIGLKNEQG